MKPKNDQNTLEILKLPKYPPKHKKITKNTLETLKNDQNAPEIYKITKIPPKPKK